MRSAVDQGQLDVSLLLFGGVVELLAQVSDGVGEDAFPEVFVYVSAVAALSLHQIARDVKEAPDLECAVDEAKWSDSNGLDESAHRDTVDEDEHPEQH